MRSICALTTPAVFRRQGSFPVLKVAIPPAGAEHELEKKEVYNMPNVKNQETLVKIKEDLNGASAVWVVDYCGLSVKDIQALRREIREAGASMKVYKNTLMHIALDEAGLPTLDDILEGPSAFVFAGVVLYCLFSLGALLQIFVGCLFLFDLGCIKVNIFFHGFLLRFDRFDDGSHFLVCGINFLIGFVT